MTKPKEHAIVIGGGIAGLAGCMRLAALGFHVTLLERHAHLGGKIRTTPSAAGPVDAGPTVLTMRHVFDALFALAGTRLDDHVELVQQDILARHFWPDGSSLDLYADEETSIAAVDAFAGPASAEAFKRFSEKAKALFEAFDQPMMQSAQPRVLDLVRHVLAHPSLLAKMGGFSSLRTALKSDFQDPRLAQLFGRYATYVGGAPRYAPAVLALIWHAEASGVWCVKGGMHKLIAALAEVAQARLGLDIRTNAHVARIETRNGGVTGVVLADGTHVPCDLAVFAGDPRALATGALGPSVQSVAQVTRRTARSFSARVHSFAAAVSGPELAHHNVFFAEDPDSEFDDLMAGRIPRDPTLYLCAEDRGLGVTPNPLERFEMIANAPANAETSDPKDLDTWHQMIMTRMTKHGVTFTPMPEAQSVTTPQSFGAMFPASLGALYGQSPHGLMAAFKRPTARTKISGLYLCGGGTHPGAGVPMAALSAKHLAEAIWQDRTSTSRSARTAMHGGMSTA